MCVEHGYHCYVFRLQAGRLPLSGYYVKVWVLWLMLPLHPWLLFLDSDAVVDEPHRTQSIDRIFDELAWHAGRSGAAALGETASVVVGDDKNFNTDVMLVRRTQGAGHFLEQVMALQQVCPTLGERHLGEQMGATLAMFSELVATDEARTCRSTHRDRV